MLNNKYRTAAILIVIFFLVIAVAGTFYLYQQIALERSGDDNAGQKTAQEDENIKSYEVEDLSLKNCPDGMPKGIPLESGVEIVRSQIGQGELAGQDKSLTQEHILCTYRSKLTAKESADRYKKYFTSHKATSTVLADTQKLISLEGQLEDGTLNVVMLQATSDAVMVSLDFIPVSK